MNALTMTQVTLGRKGSGKTNTAVVTTEEMLSAGQQVTEREFLKEATEVLSSRPIHQSLSRLDDLPSGSQKLLLEVASYHPRHISKRRVAATLGTSATKSTWRAWMAPLRAFYLIEEDDSTIWLSDAGVKRVGYVPPSARTKNEVLELWRPKLTAGSMRVLEILANHKRPLSREQLGELVGTDPGSSTMRAYLAPLRSLELIDDLPGGDIAANKEALFL